MRFLHLLISTLLLSGSSLYATAQAQSPPPTPYPSDIQGESLNYDDYMSLGYNAQQEERYYEAAQYFRYALYENPNDRAAVVAYWNARDALQRGAGETLSFDQYMNRGYDATEAGNYRVALRNFRQAYALRPGNHYANQAIFNVQTYLDSEEVVDPPDPAEGTDEAAPVEPTPYLQAPGIATDSYLGEAPYDRYMRLGYAALQEDAFTKAADYFRSALYERPNDRWATIAYWNAIDGMSDGEADLGGEDATSQYDRWMRLGYDATQREEYQAALSFFENALEVRPDDYYATEAIENVQTYLE